jgi:hypothetical protein
MKMIRGKDFRHLIPYKSSKFLIINALPADLPQLGIPTFYVASNVWYRCSRLI